MWILDIILVALLALGAYSGHKKGLVGILVGFASLILSIVLAFCFQSVVADGLYDLGLGNSIKGTVQTTIQNQLKDGTALTDTMYGKIISNAATDTSVADASEVVTRFILKGVSFIIILLVVRLICYIIQMILNVVFNLPILSSINGIGGTAVGLISVLLKVWILLAIISFISPIEMFSFLGDAINKTFLIRLMYNCNVLVAIIKATLHI